MPIPFRMGRFGRERRQGEIPVKRAIGGNIKTCPLVYASNEAAARRAGARCVLCMEKRIRQTIQQQGILPALCRAYREAAAKYKPNRPEYSIGSPDGTRVWDVEITHQNGLRYSRKNPARLSAIILSAGLAALLPLAR